MEAHWQSCPPGAGPEGSDQPWERTAHFLGALDRRPSPHCPGRPHWACSRGQLCHHCLGVLAVVCLRQQRATSGGRGQCPAPGCRQHGGGGGVCVPADPPGPLVLGQRHSLQGLHWVTPGHGRSFRAAVVWAPQAPGTRQAAASAGSRTPGDRARLAEGPGLPPGRPRARGLHASCPARGVILYYQFLTYDSRRREGEAGPGRGRYLSGPGNPRGLRNVPEARDPPVRPERRRGRGRRGPHP